ncbi:MAG: hypothetical protein R3A45_00450 [Bdellovibrionota bacterium]
MDALIDKMPWTITRKNQKTWNAESKRGERWSVPVSSQEVDRAKQGQWSIILTPQKPVPSSWFPMP